MGYRMKVMIKAGSLIAALPVVDRPHGMDSGEKPFEVGQFLECGPDGSGLGAQFILQLLHGIKPGFNLSHTE